MSKQIITLSAELRILANKYTRIRHKQISDLVYDGLFQVVYPQLLIQTYHYVKYSCPLMKLARENLAPKYNNVKLYFDKHIQEESGHDDWLLEDLLKLGYKSSVVKNINPLKPISALVGTQLYLIQERFPVGLLGYIYILESDPPEPDSLRKISSIADIPIEAMSTLISHGKEDIEHIQELNEIINNTRFDEIDLKKILYSATMTSAHLADFVSQLKNTINYLVKENTQSKD